VCSILTTSGLTAFKSQQIRAGGGNEDPCQPAALGHYSSLADHLSRLKS
jgi:hypothetical protein